MEIEIFIVFYYCIHRILPEGVYFSDVFKYSVVGTLPLLLYHLKKCIEHIKIINVVLIYFVLLQVITALFFKNPQQLYGKM